MVWSALGRFRVGFAEAEWDRQDGQAVAGRLFYPAAPPPPPAPASWLAPWRWRWLPAFLQPRGVPWLWNSAYARGLGKFLFFRLPKTLLYSVMKQGVIGVAWLLGVSQRLDLLQGADLAPDAPEQLPLVIFSHGLGGNRFLYSIICSELASQGYVVLAVEHADGTACAALLPGQGGWKLYGGLGDEAAQVAKTRVRVAEMKAALHMLQAMHRGDRVRGMKLWYGLDSATFLRGRLDLSCVAAVGHSYGGATITALVSEDPLFRCGVALDPWWYALYPETPALQRFRTRTPLLVMGSHDWNVPNAFGQLACGGERQEKVLAASRPVKDGTGTGTGGGAMLLSIAGSSHNTFADALPLFGHKSGWLLERLGLTARLDPVLGVLLCNTSLLAFLSLHLPLTPNQRAAQNWEPAKRHGGLDAIGRRDEADRGGGRRGPMSWLFPGRGLLTAVSDYMLNKNLPPVGRMIAAVSAGGPPKGSKGKEAGEEGKQPLLAEQPAGASDASSGAAGIGGRVEPPDDVMTGLEAAEAAMPSANPASGPTPHAPGTATGAGATATAAADSPVDAAAARSAAVPEISSERCAVLRAGLNSRYSGTVEAGEVEEMTALLGAHHIFKCFTV